MGHVRKEAVLAWSSIVHEDLTKMAEENDEIFSLVWVRVGAQKFPDSRIIQWHTESSKIYAKMY